MTLSLASNSGFAVFPGEIRDMIFSYIAIAAKVGINPRSNHNLQIFSTDISYHQCIEMFHEWAPRSHVAKEACEVIWSSATFSHNYYFEIMTIDDPNADLCLSTPNLGTWQLRNVGKAIELRKCVQKVRSDTYFHHKENNAETLLNYKQGISRLLQLPHLRQVELVINYPNPDAYFQGMAVVESILGACKEIRNRVGTGFKIKLRRSRIANNHMPPLCSHDAMHFMPWRWRRLGHYDISWMLNKPSHADRKHVRNGTALANEIIRVLIADGVDPNSPRTLLEELRDAASLLPQFEKYFRMMEAWEPWTGIEESYWLRLKEKRRIKEWVKLWPGGI